jgi:hypothetical protein
VVKVSDPIGPFQTAQSLTALGLVVLPARYMHEDKAPITPWKKYQAERPTDRAVEQWFSGRSPKNYWVMTGTLSGVVVIDCDNSAADAWWRTTLGNDIMDATAQVRTSKGTHYWFRIPAGGPIVRLPR